MRSQKLHQVTRIPVTYAPLSIPFNSTSKTFLTYSLPTLIMTRSHKLNDRDHPTEGLVSRDPLPRYFGKSGPTDADPRKTKKDGGGKGNWGRSGDESQDCGYTFTNARRRSNSSTQGLVEFRTKFETVEAEPVFEEQVHGVSEEDMINESAAAKVESTSSNGSEWDL